MKKKINKNKVYFDILNNNQSNEKDKDEYYIEELSKIYNSLEENQLMTDNEIKNVETLDEAKERLKLDGDVIHSFTANVESDIALKNKYASKFLWIFIIQATVFYLIFIAVGLGWLTFNEFTLRLFITGGFIETIAIIKIIVQYLFQDNYSHTLSDILEKNKKNK